MKWDGASSKKLTREIPYDPGIPLPNLYLPWGIESRGSDRNLHTHAQSSTIHLAEKMETTQMSMDRWADKHNVV